MQFLHFADVWRSRFRQKTPLSDGGYVKNACQLDGMRHTTLLLAFAALTVTSCSLQLDSQYGLRWDRRVTVPQRAESETSVDRATAEPEVAPEFYAADSEPQTEAVQAYAAPDASEVEVADPFGIRLDELPEAAELEAEKKQNKLETDHIPAKHNDKSAKDDVFSIAFKIASIIVGVVLILLSLLMFVMAYLASVVYLDDEAEILTTRGVILMTVGLLFLFLPIIYTVIKSLIPNKPP